MISEYHKSINNGFQIRRWMNDTQSGRVSGRGCQVSLGGRSPSSSGRHLRQTPRRPLSLCSGDGRLFQGGVVRISWLVKNVYIASPLISNRPLFPVPKTHSFTGVFFTPGSVWRRGCVGSQSVCAQAAWKVQPVEDCWQATGAREPTRLQRICSDKSECCSR